jgi:hypothetical protein
MESTTSGKLRNGLVLISPGPLILNDDFLWGISVRKPAGIETVDDMTSVTRVTRGGVAELIKHVHFLYPMLLFF